MGSPFQGKEGFHPSLSLKTRLKGSRKVVAVPLVWLQFGNFGEVFYFLFLYFYSLGVLSSMNSDNSQWNFFVSQPHLSIPVFGNSHSLWVWAEVPAPTWDGISLAKRLRIPSKTDFPPGPIPFPPSQSHCFIKPSLLSEIPIPADRS